MATIKTILEKRLIERIKREGPISFRDFMQAALYDAELGYYNTERLKIGAAGDYYTSSNVHPAFGAILARAFVELSDQLDEKLPFAIVEIGAGTGQLAYDVLVALRDEHPKVFARLSYKIVEQSPVMRERQIAKLKEFEGRLEWRSLRELQGRSFDGIVFSNELLDAFPVHRVRFSPDRVEEMFVTTDKKPTTKPQSFEKSETVTESNETIEESQQEELTTVWQELSNVELSRYIKRTGLRFYENQVIEINLEAIRWLETLSTTIAIGFLVTIDYGDEAAHIYSPDRREGTLRCFYRHTLTNSPLERIGEQDITASVNFSALMDYGRDFGFEPLRYERQTSFLFRYGLIQRIAAMENAGTTDSLKDRLAIKNLLAPGGISDNFRVLVQQKSAESKQP